MRTQRVQAGRKIESEEEARRCLLAAGASELSLRDWARAGGIDGRSLHAWQLNLGRRGSRKGVGRRSPKPRMAVHPLVELVPGAPRGTTDGSQRYVLELAGARFEFGDDVSEATLRRVLGALRSC